MNGFYIEFLWLSGSMKRIFLYIYWYIECKAKGIKMVPTNLVGGGKNNNSDKFAIDEKEHLVKKCSSGHKPINTTFKKRIP